MGALARLWATVTRAEGQYRPGPYYLPVSGGWLPHAVGQNLNWWQLGYRPVGGNTESAMVEACVSAYAQTVAMCPGDHWRANDKGGRDRVTTSALSRLLRYPNDYQSISDFLLNTTRSLYLEGNAYILCLRNDRFEIDEMHLMHPYQCRAVLAVTGDIFYALGGNRIIEQRFGRLSYVPQRDVLHIRLHTPRDPLLGMSPLLAAALDVASSDAIKAQQLQFYLNQARPGIVLSTDLLLDKDQVSALRDRWNEQTQGENAGGTPILTGGLKPVAIPVMTGRDAQLAEVLKFNYQDIALAFRVPLQILGIGGTPFASTEALMQSWIASGLGFCLNHIEEAFGATFNLKGPPDEYVEFSTTALLRSAYAQRIESLVKAVQGGVLSPNEARATEDYPRVPFGDECRVQQQLVPLSAASAIPAGPPEKTTIPAAPPAPPAPSQPAEEAPPGSNNDARTAARCFLDRANEIDRRAAA